MLGETQTVPEYGGGIDATKVADHRTNRMRIMPLYNRREAVVGLHTIVGVKCLAWRPQSQRLSRQ